MLMILIKVCHVLLLSSVVLSYLLCLFLSVNASFVKTSFNSGVLDVHFRPTKKKRTQALEPM